MNHSANHQDQILIIMAQSMSRKMSLIPALPTQLYLQNQRQGHGLYLIGSDAYCLLFNYIWSSKSLSLQRTATLLTNQQKAPIMTCLTCTIQESFFGYVFKIHLTDAQYPSDCSFLLQFYCLIYALLNICVSFSKSGKCISDLICTHLNYLYIFDFSIQLVNLSAYYLVHDVNQISPRYQNWITSTLITLSLIITFINESRNEPVEPIIADTVK